MSSCLPHRIGIGLAFCTLGVLGWGAVLVSQNTLSPADPNAVALPFWLAGGHRILAAIALLLALVLGVSLSRGNHDRWHARSAWFVLLLLAASAFLGAGRTFFGNVPAWNAIHAVLAQVAAAGAVAMVWVFSSKDDHSPSVADQGTPSMRSLACFAPLLVLAQVALGAAYRHGLSGLMPHVLGAVAVTIVVALVSIFTMTGYPEHSPLKRSAALLLTFVLAQMLLGIGAFMTKLLAQDGAASPFAMTSTTAAHVVLGALTFAACLTLSAQILRYVQPAHAASPAHGATANSTEAAA